MVSLTAGTKRDSVTIRGDASIEDHMSHKVGSRIFAGALFATVFIKDVDAAGRVFFEE
jgi:hypothetical protein